MLKKRIIGVVLLRGGIAVQSIGFERFLPIGRPEILVSFLCEWGIDEICLLDTEASKGNRVNYEQLSQISNVCQVPLAYGGGLRTVDDIKRALSRGADKVVLNSSFLQNSAVISEGAAAVGSQCIIVSLDIIRQAKKPLLFQHLTKQASAVTAKDAVTRAEQLGAGELLIQVVNRDGSKTGFDLELFNEILPLANRPVIACSGAGCSEHFGQVLALEKISGAAAANYFSFSEQSVTNLKKYLAGRTQIPIRMPLAEAA